METTGATFVNVSIANINDGVVYNAFDNFQYGIATIPEPSAALVFGLLASGVGVTVGRRRGSLRFFETVHGG